MGGVPAILGIAGSRREFRLAAQRLAVCAMLLAVLVSCARAPAGQLTTPMPPKPLMNVEVLRPKPSVGCLEGATRVSERACTLRQNSGYYLQRCVAAEWQETNLCRCTDPLKIADRTLREKLGAAMELKGPITAEQASRVQTLNLEYAQLTSLEGLECFEVLRQLDLQNNQIRDLSPLAGLAKLTELKVGANQISDINPIADLRLLNTLALDSNQIRSLSALAGLFRLQRLSVSANRVRDLSPLAGLVALENLTLYNNRILDISPLRSLGNLSVLDFAGNCVSDLAPVANLTKLNSLHAGFNYIQSLTPLSSMTQLEYLFLSGNHFSDLVPLHDLYDLRVVYIDSTNQRDVAPLTDLQRFDWLVFQRNPIDCDAQAGNILKIEENAKLHAGHLFHDCTPLARRARRMGFRDPLGLSTPAKRDRTHDERCKAD